MMKTGRKAIKYEGRLPDGRIILKRSVNVNEPVALIGCFQVGGRGPWHAAGVFPKSVSAEEEAERSYSGLILWKPEGWKNKTAAMKALLIEGIFARLAPRLFNLPIGDKAFNPPVPIVVGSLTFLPPQLAQAMGIFAEPCIILYR